MISASALGIIYPNLHDHTLPGRVPRRTIASTPFAGRYRLIDFYLSGMSRAGMQNIGVVARKNYQSLMDHLGKGREWDLSRKLGGLVIFPPYGRDGIDVYKGRIEALASVMDYLERLKEELVVMCDCDVAFNMDYTHLIASHRASGADVTVVYEKGQLLDGMQRDNVALCLDDTGRVTEMRINEYKKGAQNLGLNVYVVGRAFLIALVREAMVRGDKRFEEDVLSRSLAVMKVHGYEFTGYSARIYDMRSYFRESLRLLEPGSLDGLFPPDMPVYTKVRDEAPVRYAIGAHVVESLVADGCIIEGEVERCVLFRGVRVGKGARLKNCVVMQGSVISEGVTMENVVTDKDVHVGADQRLRGAANFPVYIAKGSRVL